MRTNNETGKKYALFIGAYLLVKTILNMIIGGEFVFAELLLAVIMSIALYTGIKYVNTTVAVIMMIIVIVNFDDNIINLPGSFIYLIEAAIDTGCAAALLFQSDLKKHFTNNLDIN
ncbi:MAG: hypothetical protein II729_02230 [Ruminococcus sp.]|nr:hypothetical protein [Ruminococcus sp.]